MLLLVIDSGAYSSVDAVLRCMLVFDLIYNIIIVIKRTIGILAHSIPVSEERDANLTS